MNLFAQQWSVLNHRFPELVTDRRFSSRSEEIFYPGLAFFPSRAGALTARLNDTAIHSAFDPVREAEKLISTECDAKISLCIFYGCGLGYYIRAFTERFPQKPVLVVEPDPAFFLTVLKHTDLSSLISREQIRFFLNEDPEEIGTILQQYPLTSVKVITLRPLYTKDEKFYRKTDRAIQSVLARKEINFNTIKRFGKLWVKNLFKNMPVAARAPGIASLENLFKGLPALVLASGPTLDSILPYLPVLKERFLLICVDTSLKACLEPGVAPDFAVVVDPQYWNTRHLDGLVEQPDKIALLKAGTFLLAESSTHPAVFKKLPVPFFLCSSYFPLGQYFEQIAGRKGKLGAGGSVATTAWDLARFLGAQPVFMGGLDLSYPALATHFKGAFFENAFHAQSTRLNPAATLTYNYIMQADPFPVASNGAIPVLTDIRMQVYRSWFENQLKNHGQNTYNLSATGVKIAGMPYKPLAEITDYPVIRPQLDAILKQIRNACDNNIYIPADSERDGKFIRALNTLQQDLIILETLAATGLEECLKLSQASGDPDCIIVGLAKLNRIDEEIMQRGARQIAGFLLQPFVQETLHIRQIPVPQQTDNPSASNPDNPAPDFTRIMEISNQFYQEIASAAHYHLDLLSQSKAQMQIRFPPGCCSGLPNSSGSNLPKG